MTIDCNLSWSSHVAALCKNTSKEIYQQSKIKNFLHLHARKLFFHVCIKSNIDYGLTLWDSASTKSPKPWVSLHKIVLKAILIKNTTPVISGCNFLAILSLKERLNYSKGVQIHKIMSGKVPPWTTHIILENSIYQSLGFTFSSLT